MTHDPLITLGAWNVEAAEPARLARFWARLLNVTPHFYAAMAYLPASPEGGVPMMFQPSNTAPSGSQRAHLDLTVPWGARESTVQRAVSLGAVHRWDVLDEHPHVQWSTLEDPEGNLFCLAEHPPLHEEG